MTTLQLIALCLLFFIVWFCLGYNYACRMLDHRDDYEFKYRQIQRLIDSHTVTPEHYDIIEKELMELGQMKHRNKEKTIVLSNQFWTKFSMERLNRLIH